MWPGAFAVPGHFFEKFLNTLKSCLMAPQCTGKFGEHDVKQTVGRIHWNVLAGILRGSTVLAARIADVGIGWLGVSLAFGLMVITMV